MPLWLSESDVRAVLTMGELIDAMEAALIAFSAGRVVQPVRTVLGIRERAFFGLMPALDSDGSMLGTKLVTVLPENTAKGLPSHQAAIVLFDPASGALLAVTDGRYITEARTAAVSAVSVRQMARDRRLRRAGAQPSGGPRAGPRFPRDPRVESQRGAPATICGGPQRQSLRVRRECNSRCRCGGAGHLLDYARDRRCLGRARYSRDRRRRLPSDAPRDRSAPGGARAGGGGFARRRQIGRASCRG